MTMTTTSSMSQKRRRAYMNKAQNQPSTPPLPFARGGGETLGRRLCIDVTNHPFHRPGISSGPLRQEEVLVDLLPELQGLGQLGEGQPEGPVQPHGDGQRRSVLPLQPGPPSLPFPRRGGEHFGGRLCMIMTTLPPLSQQGRRDFDVYDHDYHPFPFS